MHSFRRVLGSSPETAEAVRFHKTSRPANLGKILVFCVVMYALFFTS